MAETSFLWRDTAMRIRERFNPRAPCGARRHGCRYGQPDRTISTHAPLAGRDAESERLSYEIADFNPRAPCGARRRDWVQVPRRHRDFNPRAPCGARLRWMTFSQTSMLFQPTRPLRGATRAGQRLARRVGISTHAPLAGRDERALALTRELMKFQPTRPLRGATTIPVVALIDVP